MVKKNYFTIYYYSIIIKTSYYFILFLTETVLDCSLHIGKLFSALLLFLKALW